MFLYPKSREEWLKIRHDHVSSTDSPALFGMSPYLTALELAVALKADLPTENETNERAVWGQRLQFAIARSFAHDNALKVRAMSAYASLETGMGASFDYEIVGHTRLEMPWCEYYDQYGAGVLEIKNVDSLVYRNEWQEDEAPAHIEIQLQHQLHTCGREWGVIAVLIGGNRLSTILRRRDKEVGDAIEAKIVDFREKLSKGVMPPAHFPEDVDVVRALYGKADPGSVIDMRGNPDFKVLAEAYSIAQQMERQSADKKKSIGAQLLMLMRESEVALCPDGYKITAKVQPATLIESYERAAFRSVRVTKAKEPAVKK
jgi:putative phage-type endonuclease